MPDLERLSETERTFVTQTDLEESYLGLIQVSALNATMRFEVVDVHESDVNLTVTVDVRARGSDWGCSETVQGL